MRKRVLRTFERVGPVLALHVRGRIIETTWEHPFFALERGWTEVGLLQTGEWIRLDNGWARVEGVADTGRIETVYNPSHLREKRTSVQIPYSAPVKMG